HRAGADLRVDDPCAQASADHGTSLVSGAAPRITHGLRPLHTMNRGILVGPTMPPTDHTAVLLIAHGSRQPEANDDLHHLAEQLRRQRRYPIVVPPYLELADPDLDT